MTDHIYGRRRRVVWADHTIFDGLLVDYILLSAHRDASRRESEIRSIWNTILNYYNELSNVFQSAYKHSTEIALLKVHNDIELNKDTGKVTALTPLYLSAAFDTIDYSLLLDRLPGWYGISGTALTWIRSFLINRFQSIKIRKCFSNAVPLFCGVPRGSILGPWLFTLYTTPLSSLIHSHTLNHHLYLDDTNVYISFSTADTDPSLKQLRDCLSDISGWMANNKFRLNANRHIPS